MDAAEIKTPIRFNRWLPYWAVFQADVQLTMKSWIYRVWVFVTVLVAAGYLLYRLGVYREAGIHVAASKYLGDLLEWSVLGSVALIVVLTGGSISSERATLADSILCRGISRYQYFLGKWHARLLTVLTTYFAIVGLALVACLILLPEDRLTLDGSLVGMAVVAGLLAAVITCGVTVSAMVNNTLVGVTVLWMVLYGGGFALSLMPTTHYFPSPQVALQRLPHILKGHYALESCGQLIGWSLGASLVVAIVGMISFSRKDV
jgi:ABC-type transport system involved in multi-copper enzyme maturation permease subunit